eukprot:1161291_1
MTFVSHPLFDETPMRTHNAYHHHRRLFETHTDSTEELQTEEKDPLDPQKAESETLDAPHIESPNSPISNGMDNINDLDDMLELQLHNNVLEREEEQRMKLASEHREYNVLKLYIFILILACIAIMLVSKWARTKLLEYAHRCGIDSVNDISVNIQTNPSNKVNPRKKLHIKDPSESEKLISEIVVETRTKELFEPTLFGGESSILTSQYAQLLHSWLPIRYNWLDWKLLYNLDVDGSSMLTFYDQCVSADSGPLNMIIKDERGYIFGVFIAQTQALKDRRQSKRFFGGADTFVFRLYPNANKYEWTKINRFFVYFDTRNTSNATITIGGGKSPALTLLSNLSKGISKKCDTFNNPQLSSSEEFNCISLEVWGLIDYK